MCGLSGVFGDVTFKEEKAVKDLLIYSSVRGMDSTGLASICRNEYGSGRELRLSKEVGPFPYLFDLKSFDKLFQGVNQGYIGHNRSKTVGDASRKNAHPFVIDDIVGAHNGTIDFQNKNRLERGTEFRTDSEAIFNNISAHGIKDTIGRIEKSEAYALTWYDRKDNTMNFLRNEHRPLVFAVVNKGRTIFWGSEYELLAPAIYRHGFVIEGKFRSFTPDTHYKFFVPKNSTDKIQDAVLARYENYTYKSSWYPKHDQKKTTMTGESAETGTGASIFKPGYFPVYSANEADVETPPKNTFIGPLSNLHSPTPPGDIIASARKILSVTNEKTSDVVHRLVAGQTPMSSTQILKKRALDRAEKNGHVPYDSKDNPCKLMYSTDDIKVYRYSNDGRWITLRWTDRHEWDRFETVIAPDDMPFPIVDVNARHCFRHTGRKKHKRIYYKGYKKLLDQKAFEEMMSHGCLHCRRSPEWGNEVTFVSPEHDFLCPFCSLQPGAVKEAQDAAREAA